MTASTSTQEGRRRRHARQKFPRWSGIGLAPYQLEIEHLLFWGVRPFDAPPSDLPDQDLYRSLDHESNRQAHRGQSRPNRCRQRRVAKSCHG
jgi:hypothetical protein